MSDEFVFNASDKNDVADEPNTPSKTEYPIKATSYVINLKSSNWVRVEFTFNASDKNGIPVSPILPQAKECC